MMTVIGFSREFVLLLIESAVKGVILVALAGMIALLSWRASAAFRHLVWVLGIGSALSMLLLSSALPHWRIPIMVSAVSSQARPDEAPPQATASGSRPVQAVQATSVAVHAPQETSSATAQTSSAVPPQTVTSSALLTTTSAPQSSTTKAFIPSATRTPWTIWALLIWAGGAAVVLMRLAKGLVLVNRVARMSIPVTVGPTANMAVTAAKSMNIGQPVAVYQASSYGQATVPLTFGALKPVVLLPADASQWPEERLRAALLHEMAHVRRQDWAIQLMVCLASAVYWFNPLVWLAAQKIRAESETSCDNLVLSAGIPAADYARHLLDVALCVRDSRRIGLGAVAMAQTPKIEGRVKAVLAKGKDRSHLSKRRLTLTVMIVGFLLLPLSTLRPVLSSAADGQIKNDQANAVSVPVTPGYKETLPNGFTIDVLGVTRVTPVENGKGMFSDSFWGPDGTLLPSPLAKTGRYQKRFGWEPTPTHPLFALDLRFIHPGPAVPVSNISTYEQVTSADGHVGLLSGQPFQRFNTRKWDKGEILPVTSSPNVHTFSLRVGIAAGQWQTVATLPVRLTPQTGWVTIRLGDKPEIDYQTQYPSRIERTDTFLGTSGRLGNVARRAVMVDDSGREIQLQEGSGAGGIPMDSLTCRNGSLSLDYPKTPLPHMKAILLQTRPYQVAEFRNVQLQPMVAKGGKTVSLDLIAWKEREQRSQNNMRRIALLVLEYIRDQGERLPSLKSIPLLERDLAPYQRQMERFPDPQTGQSYRVRGRALFVSPMTGRPYRLAVALSDVPLSKVVNTQGTVLLSDGPTLIPPGGLTPAGTRWVLEAFVDGHVKGRTLDSRPSTGIVPPTTAVLGDTATANIALGQKLQQNGQPRDGIPAFRKAVQIDPNNADAQFWLANALYESRSKWFGTATRTTTVFVSPPPAVLDEAILHLQKAVQLRPNAAQWHSALGTYLSNRGREAEAVSEYRKALHLLPQVTPPSVPHNEGEGLSADANALCGAHSFMADSLLKLREYPSAVYQYEQSLRYCRTSNAFLGLGDALSGEGRRSEAKAAWKAVFTGSLHNPYYERMAKERLARQ